MKNLKTELKELAVKIHDLKANTKDYQRQHFGDSGTLGYELYKAKYEFRHKHIAYCLMRGRTLEQIEKPHEDNKPDMCYIEKLLITYSKLYVLVRTDLPTSSPAVQAGHTVAKYCLTLREKAKVWGNSTIVYLGISNLDELTKWKSKIETELDHLVTYEEPDINNETTGLAVLTHRIPLFKELRLL